MSPRSPVAELEALVASVPAPDPVAAAAAAARHDTLTKPPGSLGRIEAIGCRLAAMAGTAVPPPPSPATVVVFAADHGVHAEGVSRWPQEVTGQMVAGIVAGRAAVNAIAATVEVEVLVVDMGVRQPPPVAVGTVRSVRLGPGSANLRIEPAMSVEVAAAGILAGAAVAAERIEAGDRCLLTGDMGIANTTPSTAVIAAVTGHAPGTLVGPGAGNDDVTVAVKASVIDDALRRSGLGAPTGSTGTGTATPVGGRLVDGLTVLAEVGGFEIAGLAGLCLGAAAHRVPVIVDGVIALAGALVAVAMCPAVVGYLVAGHRSVEPGATAALDHLGLRPLLELELRLGEGTGAALAYPLVRAAQRVLADMATLGEVAPG